MNLPVVKVEFEGKQVFAGYFTEEYLDIVLAIMERLSDKAVVGDHDEIQPSKA